MKMYNKFEREKKKGVMLIYPIIGFLKKLPPRYYHNTKDTQLLLYLVLWAKLSSSNDVEGLHQSTSECDLTWSQGLYRDNQVKVRSLGWDLI